MATIYNEYFANYINLVNDLLIKDSLAETHNELLDLLGGISEDLGNYSYADNKWTIKEVIAHIIDAERVFGYRAMRFARNDKTDLPGYDENNYTEYSGANERTVDDLLNEFDLLRKSSIALYKSFNSDMLARTGTANQMAIDVESIAYLISGHCRHHTNILNERYL